MSQVLPWLGARLAESNTWHGIAAFFAAVGANLVAMGLTTAGVVVGSIGLGADGVAQFIIKEKPLA